MAMSTRTVVPLVLRGATSSRLQAQRSGLCTVRPCTRDILEHGCLKPASARRNLGSSSDARMYSSHKEIFKSSNHRRSYGDTAASMDSKVLSSVDQYRHWKRIHRHTPISCFGEFMGQAVPEETLQQLHEFEASEVENFVPTKNHDIHVAVSVERYQRIFSSPTSEETEWYNFYEKIMVEKSALMQDEIEADKKRKEDESSATAAGRNIADLQSDSASSFVVTASRETEADARDDHSTINRKLDETLYFIVNNSGTSNDSQTTTSSVWKMPTVAYDADLDKTLRETAERAVRQYLHSNTEVFFVGNFPVSSKVVQPNPDDRPATVFFFRALLVSQEFDLTENAANGKVAWVAASELADYSQDCGDSLSKFSL
eukprot:m.253598 g.253598  ORF g.253598 m.253598 type:complete len:372 (-) comp19586_c0_seq11:240-1355(-)